MLETCGGSGTHNKTIVLHGTVKAKQTNADKIRSMSDEELANALAHKANACWNCSSDNLEICKDCWLDWMKQEAKP